MKIIIAGAYAIGTHLAKLLSRNDQDIVLIDEDEERLNNISNDYDLMTIHSSPSSIQTLKNAGVQHANLFIGVTPDENMNMNSCILAKALGAKRTVAKVNNYEFIDEKLKEFFNNLGIDSLIYPENLAARDITNGLKMSWVRQRWDVHNGALIMLGIKLRETCDSERAAKRPLQARIAISHRGDKTRRRHHYTTRRRRTEDIRHGILHDHTQLYSVYQKDCRQGTLRGRKERDDNGRRQHGHKSRADHARIHERKDH